MIENMQIDMNEIPIADEPKFVFSIHYHRETGIIRNWGFDDGSTESFAGPDYKIKRYYKSFEVDPITQRIDVETEELIAKSKEEAQEYFLHHLKMTLANDLASTDQYMMPDRDLPGNQRAAWVEYRKALRVLTGTFAEIVVAWPVRPDGADPIAFFRAKL